MKLGNKELKNIKGGKTFSATLLNAIVRGITSFMDIGRYLGSSIRRATSPNGKCPIK